MPTQNPRYQIEARNVVSAHGLTLALHELDHLDGSLGDVSHVFAVREFT